jgi:methylmalonyl-CoA mutase
MINDLVKRSDFQLVMLLMMKLQSLEEKNPTRFARIISSAENFPEIAKPTLDIHSREKNEASKTPVLGITGTGGAGKSSLVDELYVVF